MARREPFFVDVEFMGGPLDGDIGKVTLHEPPPDPDWYSGFMPRRIGLPYQGYYQIGDDGNYHWYPGNE
jgi:hypothetical protein